MPWRRPRSIQAVVGCVIVPPDESAISVLRLPACRCGPGRAVDIEPAGPARSAVTHSCPSPRHARSRRRETLRPWSGSVRVAAWSMLSWSRSSYGCWHR